LTVVRFWGMDQFAMMCAKMLLNKFDCFIVIEGNRGLGKSTLAYHLLTRVGRIMKRIAKETGGKDSLYKDYYSFKPYPQSKGKLKGNTKNILYQRDEVINFFDRWNASALADEGINVSFNRDFWNEDQKNLIKLINMNRDHCNLFIMCIPQFQVLDNQIKNLCKIRVTIARRGMAVIQTPNRTIYNKDKWDTANNERIEREWLKKGSGLPKYSKLNTFRGMMRFPALTKRDESIYTTIKVNERNTIKKDLGVGGEEKKEKELSEIAVERLKEGKIRNANILDGMAIANGSTPDSFKNIIRGKLKKEGIDHRLPQYYWEKQGKGKGKEGESGEMFG